MVRKINELQFKGTKEDPMRVYDGRQIEDFTNKIVRIKGEEELVNFRLKLINNLVKQLQSIPASKTYGLAKYMREQSVSTKPLRQQIIEAILRDNSLEGINVTEGADGKLIMKIYINHDLAAALNDGTGIYNKETGVPITPKNKRYMFIPSTEYAKGYFMRKYERMGLSPADAKGRFQYGMEHNNLVRFKTKVK